MFNLSLFKVELAAKFCSIVKLNYNSEEIF